jgi:hypothetical protein
MKPVPGARVPILKYFEGNSEVALQSFSLYVNVGLNTDFQTLPIGPSYLQDNILPNIAVLPMYCQLSLQLHCHLA